MWGWLPALAVAAQYKPVRVNNRPSDVIAPRDTSVAFKWLLSRLCLDADVDLWNSIKLYGIPYRPNRVVASRSKRSRTHVIFFARSYRPRFRGYFLSLRNRKLGTVRWVCTSFTGSSLSRNFSSITLKCILRTLSESKHTFFHSNI